VGKEDLQQVAFRHGANDTRGWDVDERIGHRRRTNSGATSGK
jgi:hypothetical protein